MKHIKKLVTITLIIVLCVLIYYRYANKDSSRDINKVENDSLSEVERVLTKNLDEYYPKTPLEVVKFFTRIQKCYYNEDNTDEIVNEYFTKQMQKLIILPMKKWKAKRDKMVVSLMKEKQEQDIKHWQVNTLLTLSSLENEQYCPVLLDVSELMELVPQVVTERKLRYKVKTNFRTKARENADCFCRNDDKKLEEILSKVV